MDQGRPEALPTFGRSETERSLLSGSKVCVCPKDSLTLKRNAFFFKKRSLNLNLIPFDIFRWPLESSRLPRSASARSLSPRRPREEPKASDWQSLFVLTGELGLQQWQQLRKLRDEQEEELLQNAMSMDIKPERGEGRET